MSATAEPARPDEVDAVVIGSGPNGLVAANRLAEAGWETLVLEAQPTVGGAVRSDRAVHPDFVSDTFSAFYPLAAASPVITALELERFGLTWEHAAAVAGHPRPDGRWALLHRDPEVTADLLEQDAPGDGARWQRLVGRWAPILPDVVDALTTPFPPVRAGVRALRRLPRAGGLTFLREVFRPALRELADFRGDAARLLVVGNAAHSDIDLDGVGSGFLGLLLVLLGQTVGFPVPRGGSGELTAAMRRRLEAYGGSVVPDAPVTRILVRDGRAEGVVVGGQTVRARRAVLADVHAQRLYGGLIPHDELPARLVRAMTRFRRDPATVKLDWALSGPVPWATPPAYAPGTVHLADSIAEIARSAAQVEAGVVPDRPFLLVGQMSTADPSRSPAGTESLWAYTHVPQGVALDTDRFADLVQSRLDAYAPGFGDRVLARRVLTPADLEARDANLVGGSINGGTAAPRQELVLRPVPGLGRAETPVRGLYLASSSAHPGGAVHGACGANAARAALFRERLTRRR